MKIGDLVVHVGAKSTAYRVKMVCDIQIVSAKCSSNRLLADREMIYFPDGRSDWKDHWRVFNGWNNEEI